MSEWGCAYKFVRGFDHIHVKDMHPSSTVNSKRFSIWLKINKQFSTLEVADLQTLKVLMKQWQDQGFVMQADHGRVANRSKWLH